jgi:hypothetical protein
MCCSYSELVLNAKLDAKAPSQLIPFIKLRSHVMNLHLLVYIERLIHNMRFHKVL